MPNGCQVSIYKLAKQDLVLFKREHRASSFLNCCCCCCLLLLLSFPQRLDLFRNLFEMAAMVRCKGVEALLFTALAVLHLEQVEFFFEFVSAKIYVI